MSDIGDVAGDPASAEHIANQQAQYEQEQAAEAARVAAQAPPAPPSDDDIRSLGGYFLMDPQWNAGGPWDGGPDEGKEQRESNKRADIVERAKQGTVLPFDDGGQIGGYFPTNDAGRAALEGIPDEGQRVNEATGWGNDIKIHGAASHHHSIHVAQ